MKDQIEVFFLFANENPNSQREKKKICNSTVYIFISSMQLVQILFKRSTFSFCKFQ